MITLQEAERLLDRLNEDHDDCSVSPDFFVGTSRLLTTLTGAGAFHRPDEATVHAALVAEGLQGSAVNYTLRVLRKLGVIA